MKQELEEKLYKDFPDMYIEKAWPMNQTCMCWGFDIGNGWEPIVRQLSERIKKYLDGKSFEKEFHVVQVKEKFGGLRFYTNFSDDVINWLINYAEYLAYKTCENCGTMEHVKRRNDGWIRTLCTMCEWKRRHAK